MDRQAKINHIVFFQVVCRNLIMKRQRLAVLRNFGTDILIKATPILSCNARNSCNILVERLVNTGAIRNVGIILKCNLAWRNSTAILQGVEVRRRFLSLRIRHNDLRGDDFLAVGIIIVHNIKVAFLLSSFQIDQDKLCSILSAPCFLAVLSVDHRRCARRFVPDLALVIPLCHAIIKRCLFPCDGVRGIPHVIVGIFITRTIRYRNLGNRIIFIILRSNNANVAAIPVVEDRCGFEIHVFLGWGNRAVRVDNCNRQCDLALVARSIRRGTISTIAPVLDIGFNFRSDFCLLQIIGNRLIRAEEIMPSAVQCLILPRTGVIAHMGKGRAVSGLVNARFLRLQMIGVQPHSLPVIHIFPAVKIGIGMVRCKLCNVNARIGAYTISCSGNTLCFVRRNRRLFINRRVRNPVLQRQRSICHRVVRSLVLDNDRIQHIANHNLRRACLLTGEGDGGLINRRWCRFQRVGITLGATTAARHCPVSPGESNIIVGITTIPARDFKIEFACL